MNPAAESRGFWIILVTLFVALALTVWPIPGGVVPYWPEWVALILLHWCMALPGRVSVGVCWISGIMLDVLRGALLGQHALALTIVALITLNWHLQIRVYPAWQQMLFVAFVLSVYEFILFWIGGIAGSTIGLSARMTPIILSVLLWPWLLNFLRFIRRRYQIS